MRSRAGRLLRDRDGTGTGTGAGADSAQRGQRVTNIELFFDLVYVFAVTQLSHHLLGSTTPGGALQTALWWVYFDRSAAAAVAAVADRLPALSPAPGRAGPG